MTAPFHPLLAEASAVDSTAAPGAADATDEVLLLLQRARMLMHARATVAAEPWSGALQHVDEAITMTIAAASGIDHAAQPPSTAVDVSVDSPSKRCCTQETQTPSSPCHSTGTQANPTTASASTGTGPRPAALGARNFALQENRAS